MLRRLDALGVDPLLVSYERLTTRPEHELRRVCDAVGLDFRPEMLVPANGIGHFRRGNPTARRAADQQAVRLSTTFLARDEWLLPALLRRDVMDLNRRLVYRYERER
jgi:hypothetical protein